MTKDRRYWDSNCFLAVLMAEPGRVEVCRTVLSEAAAGRTVIVTSALAIAECLKIRGQPPIPPAVKSQVLDFFKNDFIHVRNVTRHIAEASRELVWDHGIDPKDAIHVATALDARLDLMNAYDDRLLKKSGLVGTPRLRIEVPLPPAQTDLFRGNRDAEKGYAGDW